LYYVKLNPISGGFLGTPESAPDSIATRAARYGIEAQFNYNLLNNRFLVFGASYDANYVNNKRFFGDASDYKQPEFGVYAQYEQKFFDKLKTVVGLRMDSYQIDGEALSRLSPKVNISYQAQPFLAFRAVYGQGFRVPGVTERYIKNSEFLPLQPNPDLAAEYATGYELGARGFFPIAQNWGGQFDISLFRNDLSNLVEPKFNPALNPQSFQFVNITEGKIQGIETMLGVGDKKGKYSLNLGYTYLDTQDLTLNKPLNFRSKHLLQGSVNVNPFKKWEFGVDARYASAFENVDLAFAAFVDDAALTVPTKVVDVRIGTMWKGLKATLIAKNAGEYYYMERPAILAPPRNFTLRLQYDM
jgi:outer membrane receptor for ferrienterochelin and colicins